MVYGEGFLNRARKKARDLRQEDLLRKPQWSAFFGRLVPQWAKSSRRQCESVGVFGSPHVWKIPCSVLSPFGHPGFVEGSPDAELRTGSHVGSWKSPVGVESDISAAQCLIGSFILGERV